MNEASPDSSPPNVTTLLERMSAGDAEAANELLPMIYANLRSIARMRMAGERKSHTLQATALVHEVFLKLIGERSVPWRNRAHFYAAAAEGMRQLLLDHARTKRRVKRGGGARKIPLNVADLAENGNSEQILALDAALCRLAEQNPEAARVVRLRFYAGLSIDETAAAMELSPRTVDRRWKYARAWLFKILESDDELDKPSESP